MMPSSLYSITVQFFNVRVKDLQPKNNLMGEQWRSRTASYALSRTRIQILPPSCEPRREKTSLKGFRPGPTQTRLYKHRRWLETGNFEFRK